MLFLWLKRHLFWSNFTAKISKKVAEKLTVFRLNVWYFVLIFDVKRWLFLVCFLVYFAIKWYLFWPDLTPPDLVKKDPCFDPFLTQNGLMFGGVFPV